MSIRPARARFLSHSRGGALTAKLMLAAGLFVASALPAAEPSPLVAPEHRLTAEAPAWRDLAGAFAQQPDTIASFEERRHFPFRAEPVVLHGEVRVSRARGLSLHYRSPEERIIIIDAEGMALRDATGQTRPPPDPRASGAQAALRHILRFDFAALAADHDLYGRRDGATWELALVPHARAVRDAIGEIRVSGRNTVVHRIELRRSARQHIDILLDAPRPGAFGAEDVRRFFR